MAVNETVGSFRTAPWRFLSNFWPCEVHGPGGWTYPTVEHAYQAWKTNDENQWSFLASRGLVPTPAMAKRHGNKLSLRPDWETIKLQVMENLLRQKFMSGGDLARKLAAIQGDIVEGNTWGDTYWGVCNGVGQNNLGKLLMKLRDELNFVPW